MHGWFSIAKQQVYQEVLELVKPAEVLEIGTWLGKSCRWVLEHSMVRMICVDPWKPWHTHADPILAHLSQVSRETFLANLWDLRSRIIPIQLRSEEAIPILAHAGYKPDLIYIDGSHSFEAVQSDIRMCREFFPHANLIGDDYCDQWPGVKKAVDQSGLKFQVKGSTWFSMR